MKPTTENDYRQVEALLQQAAKDRQQIRDLNKVIDDLNNGLWAKVAAAADAVRATPNSEAASILGSALIAVAAKQVEGLRAWAAVEGARENGPEKDPVLWRCLTGVLVRRLGGAVDVATTEIDALRDTALKLDRRSAERATLSLVSLASDSGLVQ